MSKFSRRILVVDDNQAIHEDFRKILCPGSIGSSTLDANEAIIFGESAPDPREPAFEVDFACQGQEALTMVCRAWNEGRPYMMAFVDVRMPPGWDGIETTARIWEVDSFLQVVICTAYTDYSWKQMTEKLNQPDRFVILRKPFDVVEVLQLANAFTEKWQLLKQMEERTKRLQESERHYHFLADAMPNIVWTARSDGRMDYANQRLQDYSGRPFEQNKDGGWQQLVHPEDLAKCLEQWTGSVRSGRPYQVEYRLKRASDGAYRWHLARAVPMRNGAKEIVYWVGTFVDIEDQKRAGTASRQGRTDSRPAAEARPNRSDST